MVDNFSGNNFGIEALQHAFDPPLIEGSTNNDPSSFSSPQTLQAGVNLSSRPSDIQNSSSERLTKSVNLVDKTNFSIEKSSKVKGEPQEISIRLCIKQIS